MALGAVAHCYSFHLSFQSKRILLDAWYPFPEERASAAKLF